MTHDMRHHVVYDCDGEQHAKVWETLREVGVSLVEAGPESHYATELRNAWRWIDADQFARAKAEVHRLRAAIVETLQAGDLAAIREALAHAEKLEWSWDAPPRPLTRAGGGSW